MQLYGTYSRIPLLRPLSATPPLLGGGFIPDIPFTTYTPVAAASDEFNGTALDTTKWWTRYHDNNGTLDHYNDELERYGNGHIVANGCLQFTAAPRAGTVGHAPSASGIVYPLFDSQMIRSKCIWRYGFVEARIKFPPDLGAWPAFWLLGNGTWPGEIDILESARNGVTEQGDMLHIGNINTSMLQANSVYTNYADNNLNQQFGFWKPPAGYSPTYASDDFHTYSLLWAPYDIATYLDGQPVKYQTCNWLRKDNNQLGDMVSTILNLAIGGSWPTDNFTTPVPTAPVQMLVDYVRVFQPAGQSQVGVATV